MYKSVYFDISGFCNAKCPWCVTANQSSNGSNNFNFIKPDDFERAIDKLIEMDLINKSSCISLYNWGEPLLHPNFENILEILHARKINFSLSTNASKAINIKDKLMENMQFIYFSMPGFSQESYNKIHGFNFRKITHNIDLLLNNFKNAGFVGTPILTYHIYQFNIGEINLAMEFCSKKGIYFNPVIAYINDFNLAMAYLNDTMKYELLKNASKDLLLYYVDDLIEHMPKDYRCLQHDDLTIDESCNVLTCCIVPKNHPDYTIGNLFDLSVDEIISKKSQKVCIECMKSGLAYWTHNPCVPSFVEDIVGKSLLKKVYNNRIRYIRKGKKLLSHDLGKLILKLMSKMDVEK